MKWGVRKNPQEAYEKSIKKLRKLSTKSEKFRRKSTSKQYLADRRKDMAYRAFTESGYRRSMRRARASERTAHKYAFKSVKMDQKAKKWVSAMNKEFANVTISNISPDDVSLGKRYALELMERK